MKKPNRKMRRLMQFHGDRPDIENLLSMAKESSHKRKHFDDGGGADGGGGGDGGGWGGGDDGGGWGGGDDSGGWGSAGDSWGDDGLGGWTGAEDAGPAGPEGMADEDAAAMNAGLAASPDLAAALGLTSQDMDLSNVGLEASAPESETYSKSDLQAAPGWFGANLDAGPASFEAGREASNAALAGYFAGMAESQAMQDAPAQEAPSSPFGGLPGSISENTGLDAGPGTIGGSISAAGRGEGFVGANTEDQGPSPNASPETGTFEYAAEWGAPSPSSPFGGLPEGISPNEAQEPEAPSTPMELTINGPGNLDIGAPDTSAPGAPAGSTAGTTEGSVGIGGPSIGGPSIGGPADEGPSAPDTIGGGDSLWPPLRRYPDGSYRTDESAFNEIGMKRGGVPRRPVDVEQALRVARDYSNADRDSVLRFAHMILSQNMSSPRDV